MTLVLTPHNSMDQPVDVRGILPSLVCGKTLPQVERLEILAGGSKVPLAEMFRISGDSAEGRIEWQGELAHLERIGEGMDGGEMLVYGRVGAHLGSRMSAGSIRVEGRAGDWLGAEMRGGVIYVAGGVGNGAGAAYDGSPQGMTGGTILVEGPASVDLGRRMSCGLIAVGGVEDRAGAEMHGGTVLVFGPCGARTGARMRRGTVALLGRGECQLLSGFRHACRFRPLFFPLLTRALRQFTYPVPEGAFSIEVELFHGDWEVAGHGEILLAVR